MTDQMALGEFLRARRESVTPEEVGLPSTGRRRTPGLRREELATLAGISVDYIVRLEQGRDTNPSGEVMAALAHALRLGPDDLSHLQQLAAITRNAAMCPVRSQAQRAVAPTVRALLDRLEPGPAYVAGPFGDLLAWNTSFAAVAGPLGMLAGAAPNLTRHAFLDPTARTVYADWRRVAEEHIGRLRSAAVRWPDDARLQDLLADLQDAEEFQVCWAHHPVAEPRRATTGLAHPTLGDLVVDVEVLLVPGDGEQRLVVWAPHDEATAAALARSTRLRAVGS